MNSSVGHSMPISCTRRWARAMYCAVQLLEQADLRLFAGEGAHQARAGVVLLRLRGDFGEAVLDALEAIVDLAAEVLDEDAGQRHGRPGHQGEPWADAKQEEQRADCEEDGVGAVHQGRTQQHAHRIQVVGHAGHDVAGAVPLIETGVLAFQLPEEIVAQIEFDFARDADQDPALGVEEDAFDEGDSDKNAGEKNNAFARDSVLQFVDCLSQNLRETAPRRCLWLCTRAYPRGTPTDSGACS